MKTYALILLLGVAMVVFASRVHGGGGGRPPFLPPFGEGFGDRPHHRPRCRNHTEGHSNSTRMENSTSSSIG